MAKVRNLWRRWFSPETEEEAIGVYSDGGSPPDSDLVRRIKKAYREAMQRWPGVGDSMWAMIGERQAPIHEALLAEDNRLQAMLADPSQTDLFYGFDNLCYSIYGGQKRKLRKAQVYKQQIDRLGEALGVRPIQNPESTTQVKPLKRPPAEEVEETLGALDGVFGLRVEFPNPYPNEFGMPTSRGIATYRATQALYQVFRLRQLAREIGPRMLEIGAGLGRTAGYAHSFGLRSYTIVDLPMANVAQASFLGQTLGPDSVTLLGEKTRPDSIRIMTPEWLRGGGETFDIVLNADSMTEMDRKFADEYAAWIQANAKCFLSINHDANIFRVCDLAPLKSMSSTRFPYWMRNGYTEECFVNAGQA